MPHSKQMLSRIPSLVIIVYQLITPGPPTSLPQYNIQSNYVKKKQQQTLGSMSSHVTEM